MTLLQHHAGLIALLSGLVAPAKAAVYFITLLSSVLP